MSDAEKLENLVQALVELDNRLDAHVVRMVGASEGVARLEELCRAARVMAMMRAR